MSKERITPKQAFDAIVLLWPETKSISPGDDGGVIGHTVLHIGDSDRMNRTYYRLGCEVVWGDQTQYPEPPPRYRPAKFPEDWGKECRVTFPWFHGDEDLWYYGHRIVGLHVDPHGQQVWGIASMFNSGNPMYFSQIRVEVQD